MAKPEKAADLLTGGQPDWRRVRREGGLASTFASDYDADMSRDAVGRIPPARRARTDRLAWVILVVLALTTYMLPVAAQPVAPTTRSAARKLGGEGILLYRRGNYKEASDRLERAYQLYPAPTLGVRSARALVKLGRWVEAAERYLDVTKYDLSPRAPWKFRQARAEATTERDSLLPRIPSLELLVDGPFGDGIVVTINGNPLASALVGTTHPIDPGEYVIRVSRGALEVTESVVVVEGKTSTVAITLPPLPPPPTAEPPPPPPPQIWPPLLWSAAGLAGGGFLAFAINGAIALKQDSELAARCPGRVCPLDARDLMKAFDTTRIASTVGLILGSAGALAGGALLIFSPVLSSSDGDGSGLNVLLGPGTIGLGSTF